jgi:hypothetical protein
VTYPFFFKKAWQPADLLDGREETDMESENLRREQYAPTWLQGSVAMRLHVEF